MVSINGNFGFFDKNNKPVDKTDNKQTDKKVDVPVGKSPENQSKVSEARMEELLKLEGEQAKARFNEALGFYKQPSAPKATLTPQNVELTPEEFAITSNMAMDRNLMTLNEMTGIPNEPLNNAALHLLRNDVDGFGKQIDLDKLNEYLTQTSLDDEISAGFTEYLASLTV